MQAIPNNKKHEDFYGLHLLLIVLLTLSSRDLLAATTESLLAAKYTLHAIKLLNLGILMVILLRKSIGHQRRLNWFFGAVSVVLISSQTLVFERFFGTNGSPLNNGLSSFVLLSYFLIYWVMTWNIKTPSKE
jgi:hypothetical protein